MESADAVPPAGETGALELAGELPELAAVHWRERVDEASLHRADRRWTLTTVAHVVPFLAIAVGLPLFSLITLPVSVIALGYAWLIPELYAKRGAGALRTPRNRGGTVVASAAAEGRALGLLGDLVDHDARELLVRCGMALQRGELGVWLVASAGALLVRPGGRRVQCYCVRATGEELPPSDRVAHLLLALRADEAGFATVANLTFSGACWRLWRRLPTPQARIGFDAAIRAARSG